ncbi:VOC family protein [Terricaulis sp.]|uniref:VOC family protein n=1 Tax=Terricaulis sp. TaxID=2768686 RepID=UPI0037835FB2
MHFNHVTVMVTAVAPALAFYKMLGFRPIVLSPHYARFEAPEGDMTFSIELTNEVAQNGAPIVYFECADLDAVCAQLEKAGVAFEARPMDQSWLWREAHLRDPSGNRICLYWAGENRKHPPWRIADA